MSERPGLRLTVASPCSKNWSAMKGTAQKRFCDSCQQHVYDLSAMPWEEVRALLDCEKPPCVKFFQRADGTVLTADCPVGRARKWRNIRRVLTLAAAAVAAWVTALRTARPEECNLAEPPFEVGEQRRAQLPERARTDSMGRRIGTIGVIRGVTLEKK